MTTFEYFQMREAVKQHAFRRRIPVQIILIVLGVMFIGVIINYWVIADPVREMLQVNLVPGVDSWKIYEAGKAGWVANITAGLGAGLVWLGLTYRHSTDEDEVLEKLDGLHVEAIDGKVVDEQVGHLLKKYFLSDNDEED